MSRYTSSGSTGHVIEKLGEDWYRMEWTVDYYYSGSRLRFPRRFRRDTDIRGAIRFCDKWNLLMPEENNNDKTNQ